MKRGDAEAFELFRSCEHRPVERSTAPTAIIRRPAATTFSSPTHLVHASISPLHGVRHPLPNTPHIFDF